MVSRDGDLTKAQDQWIGARVTSDAHQNLSEGQQAGFACLNVTQQGGLRSGSVFSSARRRRDFRERAVPRRHKRCAITASTRAKPNQYIRRARARVAPTSAPLRSDMGVLPVLP